MIKPTRTTSIAHTIAVVATLALPAHQLTAQGTGAPLEIGRTHHLVSRVLRETRAIDVSLPRSYATTNARYPVVVVLDAEVEHEVAASLVRFYAASGQMPQAIVVGVRNTNRMRDLTPPATGGFQPPGEASGSGGAEAFARFIAEELLLWVDSTYRTAPMRVLVGHSLGGLFGLYTLARQPALFTGYVVMEPATWWNNERHIADARSILATPAARRARVLMVNAPALGLDTTQWGGNYPMVRELSVAGETHESMAAAGMLVAFRTLFADFRPQPWQPGRRPVEMLERYDSLSARVGFAVPIPANAFERAARMSMHGRFFEDAARVIDRMESALGQSASSQALRTMLAEERGRPVDPALIPLVIPARRPSPQQALRFIGRWISEDRTHELDVRAAGDTIVVYDRIQLGDGSWDAGCRHVIQITADGTLEWGLPWFINIPALMVLKGAVQPDGSLRVTREPRGWVPRGPMGDMSRAVVFRRVEG